LRAHDETLLGQDHDLFARVLPGPDPNRQWVGAIYTYDDGAFGFDLVCRIGQLGGQYGAQYALRCTRPHPMVP
jgi:hypothetical protein